MGQEKLQPGEYFEEYEKLRQELLVKASELILFKRKHISNNGSGNEHQETLKALEQIFPKS